MVVGDIMTRNVITISPDASLKELGLLFKEKRISGIPIVNDDGNLVGIVTISDMLRVLNTIYTWRVLKFRADGKLDLSSWHEEEKLKSKVQDIMTKEVVTLSEQATVDDLMRMVFTKNIHTIPIIKEGKLTGIIGMRDLVYACF
ncbi:MAG: CBS domain-containing protein [Deltaproteobacteria bacterium]